MDAATPRFWGAQTSYLNFCEQDYVVTKYIAEFINTLSSLVYVVYGFYGLFNGRQNSPTGPRLVSYCGLIGVGVCSGAYHMTLKYHTQMSDELSMHLLTTPLVYRVLTFNTSPQRTKLVGVITLTLFTITMVAHMVMDEFILHAVMFGLSVVIITVRITQLIPQRFSDPVVRKTLQTTARMGCLSFLFGYTLWLIDEFACRMLTDVRHLVGLPIAFLFELHGWWHVFTALGGYIGVAVVDLITSGEVDQDPISLFAWPVPFAVGLVSESSTPKKQA
ncbi:ceramidase [Ilyonectria robusta]|uniref:ceramidase n=1 Tax=Ilyonectria robusta TaxID=1079257 RepID=UPI001E8E5695|nr:ceramidase [Ilyonectria robusta]KAH8656848.1 ceramidase [Ilyonectria robusta]